LLLKTIDQAVAVKIGPWLTGSSGQSFPRLGKLGKMASELSELGWVGTTGAMAAKADIPHFWQIGQLNMHNNCYIY